MFHIPDFGQNDMLIFLVILIIAIVALVITKKLLKVSTPYFFMGMLGLVLGLLIGWFISSPLSSLPGPYGRWLPMIVNIFVAVAILDLFIAQAKTVEIIFNKWLHKPTGPATEILLDTSALIDGRILSLAQAGFIFGKLLIPSFVLKELQIIADSNDDLKRAKGRRGLEMLEDLQNLANIDLEILSYGEDFHDVDGQLINLAKRRRSKILTCDYNLMQTGRIQKVEVLNVGQLSEALKPLLIPGEEVAIKIIQKGKEKGQGVGYLPDGTMIVVEGGDKFVGQEINCQVSKIYQTTAGKIIFVQPSNFLGSGESKVRRDR